MGTSFGLSLLEDRSSRSLHVLAERTRAYHRWPLRERALSDLGLCICYRLLPRKCFGASADLVGMLWAPVDRFFSSRRTAVGGPPVFARCDSRRPRTLE